MLKVFGVEHRDFRTFRTQDFNETDALIANKVNTALEHDMTVIFLQKN
jgi:triosephosphate isomerase